MSLGSSIHSARTFQASTAARRSRTGVESNGLVQWAWRGYLEVFNQKNQQVDR